MSEEIKDAIWRLNDIKRAYPLDKSDEWAVDMAIAALSAEPCSDAISKEKVIDILDYWYDADSDGYVQAAKSINELPPVHAEPRTGQSKSIPSGLKLKIEREADYQNERVNADIARGMYLALEIIEKWEADHA